jgi:hypothetical protein
MNSVYFHFSREDGGSVFHRNVGTHISDYTELQSRNPQYDYLSFAGFLQEKLPQLINLSCSKNSNKISSQFIPPNIRSPTANVKILVKKVKTQLNFYLLLITEPTAQLFLFSPSCVNQD